MKNFEQSESMGLFITFEGIEGCGKSTQINRAAEWLRSLNKRVIVTREPGEGEFGEMIRRILLNAEGELCAQTELLLFLADRAQHVYETIRPALMRGSVVLCDRYEDSTVAYQGAARGLGEEFVLRQSRLFTNGLLPHLTFFLDVPVQVGLNRLKSRKRNLDRIEQEDMEFHHSLRAAYLRASDREPNRIIKIDGTMPVDRVFDEIKNKITNLFTEKGS